jgi:hypothetical protein
MGHRPGPKGGYFPVNPIDSAQDLRGEMLAVMGELGMKPEKHHHEVAPAQHELGLKFDTMVVMADRMQLYKYVIHNVAHAYGKTATFMAKPMFGDNGSGMHVHQSIWQDGKPLFAGDKYAGLSDMCLWYIGGIIKHAKAINAFSNSTTNSYKRLVPGYEAPVKLAYSVAQPLGLDPHPARRLAEGQASGSPLPRPDGQPVPDLRRPADGRPGRHQQQDRSGRARRQEPLRPAAPRAEEDPGSLRFAPRSSGKPRQGPRLPEGRRRHGRRLHRQLHRAEDGRGDASDAAPAPGRIRHVLQVLWPPVPAAFAQDTKVGDVIVTAQKRSENLQDVPVSVATIGGEKLQATFAAGDDILALSAKAPGLYAESSNGRAAPRFYIRGLGNADFDLAASQPVSIIQDDVVLENVVLKSSPIYDLDQVEVLRGPQGTLFGRNTTAGIVKFDTVKPSEDFKARATADLRQRTTP